MTDIVERLRATATQGPDMRRTSLMNEAADEIERLKEAKRAALKIADERSKENCALWQENERLWEALRDMVEISQRNSDPSIVLTAIRQCASHALEQYPTDRENGSELLRSEGGP